MNNRVKVRLYRLICYVCSIVLAFSVSGGFAFAYFSIIANDKGYMDKYFTQENVTSILKLELDERLEAVAEEEKIPSDILTGAFSKDFLRDVQVTASSSVKKGTLVNLDESTSARGRVVKALEESGLKLSESKEKRITDKTIEALKENYSIKNASEFGFLISVFSRRAFLLSFASIVAGIFCAAVIYFLNGRRKKSFNFFGMSFVTAGELMTVLPLFMFAKGYHISQSLTNIEAYNGALMCSMKPVFCLIVGTGVMCIIAGIAMFVNSYRYYSVRYLRSDTDYEIQKNLIF